MASVGKFTDKGVQSLKAADKRRVIWEASAHGQGNLGLRIFPSGIKTWVYMYRHAGKARMQTLGNYPAMTVADAHSAVAKAGQERAKGIDPAAKTVEFNQSMRDAVTVSALADQYLELYARPRKRSADRDEALLRRNVLPTWGAHKAIAITRGHLARLLDGIVARGAGIQANRTRAVVSRMFSWAVEREMVDRNPATGLPAPVKEGSGKDRALSEDELGKVLGKLETAAMYPATRLALRFILLTAARPGEVAGAQWGEVDDTAATWTIPAERSKNKRPHRLPLSPQALAVLQEARALDRGCGAIFPSPQHRKGEAGAGAAVGTGALSQGIIRNLEHLGVAKFTPHDLRRTVATGLAAAKLADWALLQRILNHTPQGVTARYERHPYLDEMRVALTGWGSKVAALATEPST